MTRDCQSCFSNPTHFCFNFEFFSFSNFLCSHKNLILHLLKKNAILHDSPIKKDQNDSQDFGFTSSDKKKTVYIRILITILPFTSSLQNPISACHEIKFLHNSILPLTFVSLFFFPIIKKG